MSSTGARTALSAIRSLRQGLIAPKKGIAYRAHPRLCARCLHSQPPPYEPLPLKSSSRPSSNSSSRAGAGSRRPIYAVATATVLGISLFGFWHSPPDLTPDKYFFHPIAKHDRITPDHVYFTVKVPPSAMDRFDGPAAGTGTLPDKDETVTIHHVMIQNPDLQIEREYTPVNDVMADGEMRFIVKRVKGGELGRMIHNLKPSEMIGIRGPMQTLALTPSKYDKIVMISTGTAVAPFLQLLAKLPPSSSSSSSPVLHLIHSLPSTSDFVLDPSLLPAAQTRHPDLSITRPDAGPIPASLLVDLRKDKAEGKRLLVLVCLPPKLLQPLCGTKTLDRKQGPITGLLGELGLTNAEVWKLD